MKNNPVGVVLTISYFLGIADFSFIYNFASKFRNQADCYSETLA